MAFDLNKWVTYQVNNWYPCLQNFAAYERKFDNLKNRAGIMSTLFAPESINKKPGCGLYFTFFLKRRVEFHSSHFYNWKLEYQDISIMKYEVLSYMSWTFASEKNVNDSRRLMNKEGAFFDPEKCSSCISRLWPLWRTNEQKFL